MTKIHKKESVVTYSIEKGEEIYNISITQPFPDNKEAWTIKDSKGEDVLDSEIVEEIVFLIEAHRNYEVINSFKLDGN
jgi:hypothetical protein